MTFVLSGEVRISGKTAKAEIKDLEQSQDKLKASSQRMSAEGRKAASSNRQMGAAARGAATDYDRLSVAERRAAREAMTFGRASKSAAGHTRGMAGGMRNLGLQLNQVAQVGGMTGNWMQAFAVQLPDMLLGFGALGIGVGILAGAMIPLISSWADGADKAEVLEDAISALEDAMGSLRSSGDALDNPISNILGKYEDLSAEAFNVLQIQHEIARLRANRAFGKAASAASDALGGEFIPEDATREQIERVGELIAIQKDLTQARKDEMAALTEMGRARSEADDARLLDLRRTLAGLSDFNQETAAQNEFLQNNQEIYDFLKELEQQFGITTREAAQLAGALIDIDNTDDSAERARSMAELAQHIFDSTDGLKDASDEALELYDALVTATEKGLELSAIDLVSNISAGVDEIRVFTQEMWNAVSAKNALEGKGVTGGRGNDPRQFTYLDEYRKQLADQDEWELKKNRPRGGGAGQEAQALARLFEQQQLQLDILRETDPLLQEMLRHRKALSGATDEERAMLEQLITTRVREEEAITRAQEQQKLFGDITEDALRGLIFHGEKLSDVMKNVAASIAEAVFQSALLGTGPLANLFGDADGGLIGTIGDAIFGTPVGRGAGVPAILAPAAPVPLRAAQRSGSAVPPADQAAQPIIVRILPGPEFDARIEETSGRISVEVVTDYDRDVMPGSVQRVLEHPRRIG